MRLLLSAALCLILCMASPAVAQDPVAERAVAAAKEYVKAKGLKDPKLTILLSSLYNNSFPDFAKKWEELTGVKFEIVRSEEHTSELQSLAYLVCRLLLEKKKER